jgi:hypothetical protein
MSIFNVLQRNMLAGKKGVTAADMQQAIFTVGPISVNTCLKIIIFLT